VSAREGVAERVTLTADDATMAAVEGIVVILHARGFVVERRAFVRAPAEEPRRVVLLTLEWSLPSLVALVAPPTAPPGLGVALAAALYPNEEDGTATLYPNEEDGTATLYPNEEDGTATLQLKGKGVFVSMTAGSGSDMSDALLALARRVRSTSWQERMPDGGERRIAYVGRRWYVE